MRKLNVSKLFPIDKASIILLFSLPLSLDLLSNIEKLN